MTQIIDDYISKLTDSIISLPKSRQRETVAFYREFLLDGDFQTKEEILRELGKPASLADSIKTDYEEADNAQTFPDTDSESSDNYILNFHVKKIPLRKRTIHPSEFSQVKLEMNDADVVIHSGKQFEIKVVDFESRPIEVKNINHTILVKELPSKEEKHVIMINWHSAVSHVEITVPCKDSLSHVSGYSKNGDIVLQSLSLQDIAFELKNADIFVNNLDVKKEVIITSKNGNLNFSQSKMSDISIKLHNGDAELERSILNLLMIQLHNGDCRIEQCNAHLNIESRDGDIEITRSQLTNENLIRSSAGDISIRQLVHDISIKLNTEEGNISYHNSSIGNSFSSESKQIDTLQVLSKDGDISIH